MGAPEQPCFRLFLTHLIAVKLEMDLATYIVTEQDTVEGLAFKFNMTLYSLLRVNGLSRDSTIFPGKALRVKLQREEDFTPLVGSLPRVATRSNLHIYVPEERSRVAKLPAYYCVPAGEVKGSLTVTHYVVMFNPDVIDSTLCSVYNGDTQSQMPAAGQQALLDLFDLETCTPVHQRGWLEPCSSDFSDALIYLKFQLKSTALDQTRGSGLYPVALFRLSCLSPGLFPYSEGELEAKASEIAALVNTSISSTKFPLSHRSLTHVPYVEWTRTPANPYMSGLTLCLLKYSPSFELYAEDEEDFAGFQPAADTQVPKGDLNSPSLSFPPNDSVSKAKAPLLINNFPTDILSAEAYEELVYFLPPVLQLRSWELLFSLPTHGCSMSTFYRQSALCGPSILLVEDAEKHVFGGFAPETWKVSKMYYGTGEAFLFTFHTENRIKAFFATFTNEYYMMADRESLSMGAG